MTSADRFARLPLHPIPSHITKQYNPLYASACFGAFLLFSPPAGADTIFFADQARLVALNRSTGTVTASDIDNDGNTDFVVFAGGVLIYLNHGGALLPPVLVSKYRPDAVADLKVFNGDRMVDLFVKESTPGGTGAVIRLHTAPVGGVRQFANPVLVALDGNPVAIGHFNGDAHPDLFATLSDDGDAGFLFGDSNGGFTAGPSTPDGVSPYNAEIVDWDDDGNFDLISKRSHQPLKLYKQEGGVLGGPIDLLPAYIDFDQFALADIDGDGRADIGLARDDGDFDFAVQNPSVDTFAPLQTLLSSLDELLDPDAAQLHDDARPDLVLGNVSDVLSVVQSEGTRGFKLFETVATTASDEYESGFGIKDFDGLNGDDLIHWNSDTGALELLLNDGTGAFAAPLAIGAQAGESPDFEVGDFDGDTLLDFAVLSRTPSRVIVYLQSPVTPLTFTATMISGTMSAPDCLHATDLDQDGNIDLLVGGYNGSDGEVALIDNTGAGVFATTASLFTHDGTVSRIRSANLNPGGGSDIDLIVLENDGVNSTATVYANTGGRFTPDHVMDR